MLNLSLIVILILIFTPLTETLPVQAASTSNFLIPTLILTVVFSQVRAYFGYRFHLTDQLINMSRMLTDITILMIVGSVPDYVQGFVKLYWILVGNIIKRPHVMQWHTQS